ncbi:hypothetical protein HanPI659440_Chr00c21g0734871 [Helianthus annuus]|nr:hypothetical protein HanPI659440_Chr00c21g0734871 [Helianthus annuus]
MEEAGAGATVTYGGYRKLRWRLKSLRQFSTALRWWYFVDAGRRSSSTKNRT